MAKVETTTQRNLEAHTESSIVKEEILPQADVNVNNRTRNSESDSTLMLVGEDSLVLNSDTEETLAPKPEPIRQSSKQKWQVEAHKFIAKDLQRYSRLPKGGCRIYIQRKATEDLLGILKDRVNPL